MKRQISREKNVDAFSINLDELERFCKNIASRFPKSDDVSFSINVNLENESLTFDSADELKEFDELPKSVNSFHIFFFSRSFDKNFYLRASRFSLLGLGQTSISATADSEGWCADVIETAVSILKKNRVWYFWFYKSVIPLLFLFVIPLLAILAYFYSINWITEDNVNLIVLVTTFLYIYMVSKLVRFIPNSGVIKHWEINKNKPKKNYKFWILILTFIAVLIGFVQLILKIN